MLDDGCACGIGLRNSRWSSRPLMPSAYSGTDVASVTVTSSPIAVELMSARLLNRRFATKRMMASGTETSPECAACPEAPT